METTFACPVGGGVHRRKVIQIVQEQRPLNDGVVGDSHISERDVAPDGLDVLNV